MSKKTLYIIVALLVVLIIGGVILVVIWDRDMSRTGLAVKTQVETQDVATADVSRDGRPQIQTRNNGILVTLPAPYSSVASPVIVSGEAVAFEGTVQVVIRNKSGDVIARSFATANAADMGELGFYKVALAFDTLPGEELTVEVFEESAHDGLPIHMVRIPVVVAEQTINYSIFFAKEGEQDRVCDIVHAVQRTAPHTLGVARAALEHLFAGPTEGETASGYLSVVPQDVKINSLAIREGIAYADLSEELNKVAGSCAVIAARTQIEKTLLELSTVSGIVLSVNGDTELVLQP